MSNIAIYDTPTPAEAIQDTGTRPCVVLPVAISAVGSGRLTHAMTCRVRYSAQRALAVIFAIVVSLSRTIFAAESEKQVDVPTTRATVHLETPEDRGPVCRKLLARELIRQSFLLTVREEFRLGTRDAGLREGSGPDDRSFRIEIASPQFGDLRISLAPVRNHDSFKPWTAEFKSSGETQIEALAARAEEWSQKEFVEWLKGVQLPMGPVPTEKPEVDLKAAVPLEFVSQISALRNLHAALLHDPKSASLTAAIARHYAILGSLCETHWGGEHKIFKARSLLYAERAVRFGPADADAAWAKSLACALCGTNDVAVRELKRARSISDPRTTPPWAGALECFANWDENGLLQSVKAGEPLAAYFLMRSVEICGTGPQRINAVGQVLKTSPECLRATAILANGDKLMLRRQLGSSQLQQFLRLLPEQVVELPGISNLVAEVADSVDLKATTEDVFDQTAKLVKVLDQAGKDGDRGEPSLSTVATLASNLHFVHAMALLQTEQFSLGIDASDSRKRFERLLPDHPARRFLDVYQRDTLKGQHAYIEAAPALIKLPVTETSWQFIHWLQWLRADNVHWKLEDLIRAERDDVVPDLAAKLNDQLSEGELGGALIVLRKLSPECPGAIVATIKHDWRNAEPKAKAWMDQSSSPLVVRALGERYEKMSEENSDDRTAAEQCWKKLVAVEPSADNYRRLADHYKKFDNDDQWKQALLKLLELPDLGLETAQAHKELADWYMDRLDWKRAKPHAMAAAESYSAWGLACGSQCMEGLGEWDRAATLIEADSRRYQSDWISWYLFCRRTGRGDIAAAKQYCEAAIAKMTDHERKYSESPSIYAQLEGDLPRAVESCRTLAETKDPNGFWAIQTMLLLDQLERYDDRDAFIRTLNEKSPPFAQLFSQYLIRLSNDSGPPLSKADWEFCYGHGAVFDNPTNAAYFIGKLLLQKKRKEEAIPWLQLAASSPAVNRFTCTLAARELQKLNAEVPPRRANQIDDSLAPSLKLVSKAMKYLDENRVELAGKTMESLVAEPPEWPAFLFCRAQVFSKKEQWKEAANALTDALQRAPNQPMLLAFRGRAREAADDKSGAIMDYEAALKIAPSYQYALSRLASLRSGEKGK
jgi:tetratricopeptide (TPR) repeat protein